MYLERLIEKVMSRAVLRAIANGITDPTQIRNRMMLARAIVLNAWASR